MPTAQMLVRGLRCPHCGGNLYFEPETELRGELVCLQCMRRFPCVQRAQWTGSGKPRQGHPRTPS
jgi:hypothetical protein